jgi:transcriptional regulator with XRE-family HTH domain
MTLGYKLAKLRKEHNYTYEQLAAVLGVSRQAVSKWESDLAYPETDKLIRLSELFGCSLDYLLRDDQETQTGWWEEPPLFSRRFLRERKSERTLWGLPLWHIGREARGVFAIGMNAQGVVAVGLKATGVISFGAFSVGLLSFGMVPIGLLSLGLFALGLLSAGCFAVGLVASGAISFGVLSLGAVAVGDFSAGALAIGKYAAIGDHARGCIALGDTQAVGSVFQKVGDLTEQDVATVKTWLDGKVPAYLTWANRLFQMFLG